MVKAMIEKIRAQCTFEKNIGPRQNRIGVWRIKIDDNLSLCATCGDKTSKNGVRKQKLLDWDNERAKPCILEIARQLYRCITFSCGVYTSRGSIPPFHKISDDLRRAIGRYYVQNETSAYADVARHFTFGNEFKISPTLVHDAVKRYIYEESLFPPCKECPDIIFMPASWGQKQLCIIAGLLNSKPILLDILEDPSLEDKLNWIKRNYDDPDDIRTILVDFDFDTLAALSELATNATVYVPGALLSREVGTFITTDDKDPLTIKVIQDLQKRIFTTADISYLQLAINSWLHSLSPDLFERFSGRCDAILQCCKEYPAGKLPDKTLIAGAQEVADIARVYRRRKIKPEQMLNEILIRSSSVHAIEFSLGISSRERLGLSYSEIQQAKFEFGFKDRYTEIEGLKEALHREFNSI